MQQQMQYDGQSRMMNGGGGVPPMMHMQNAPPLPNNHPMYSLYDPMDQHMSKLEQSWDAQMLMQMEDKQQHMNWKWNN
jgi:hypothetical protein